MTEVRDQRAAVRNQRAEMNRRDAEGAGLFLCALCASMVKSISDPRVLVSGLCALLIALCVSVEAQQPTKVPRIGYLTVASRSTILGRIEAFQQGMRALGYVENKNIIIEWRFGAG
jgi:hypothetical protein